MVTGLWYTNDSNIGSLSWFWRCKEHACPLSPDFGLWRILEVPDWGLASWSWSGYGHWSLVHQWFEFRLPILIVKVQRTFISFNPISTGLGGDSSGPGRGWISPHTQNGLEWPRPKIGGQNFLSVSLDIYALTLQREKIQKKSGSLAAAVSRILIFLGNFLRPKTWKSVFWL